VSDSSTTRRSQLLAVKLRALVSDHQGQPVEVDAETFPTGAALLHDGVAWVLADGSASRSLGGALVWAIRRSATHLQLIAEHDTGLLARRSASFSLPISVWFAEGRTLLPAVAEPLAEPVSVSADHEGLRSLIVSGGATPNIEHGVLFGEVRGLEVCRVVDRPTTGFLGELSELAEHLPVDDGGLRLEVGVGAADREAFQLLHGEVPTVEALASVVQAVVAHRSTGSPQHPLNRLGVERFLRWQAEQEPALVGCASLTPGQPPLPRSNLKDPTPCVGDGVDTDGRPVRVVFSSGVDLDVLPYVADVQAAGVARVRLALPERDLLPVVSKLADLLVEPVEIVALPAPAI
jgi:hypothetical protein